MDQIAASIGAQEWWRAVGYWILVVGLIGEIATVVIPKQRERLEKILSGLFTAIIIVGVAVEHNADNKISDLISEQETTAAKTIAGLEKEAKEAELELANLKASRHLQTSANFEAVGKTYLAGKKFDLSANPDFEPMMLALEIRRALSSIGMIEQLSNTKDHWNPPNHGMPIGTILRPGVAVRACVNPVGLPSDKPTTERILAGLLADSGLGAKDSPVFLEPWEAADCSDPALLHVEVGSKIVSPWTPSPGAQVIYPRFQLSMPEPR